MKKPIRYIHNEIIHTMPEDQVKDFFEDNDLMDEEYNRGRLLDHFIYFKLLHKIFDISNQIPLFINFDNPTPYIPQKPSRNLTTPFHNLTQSWVSTKTDISNLFTYRNIPEKFVPVEDPYPIIHSSTSEVISDIQTRGRNLFNDLWLEDNNIIFPYSFRLGLCILYPYVDPTYTSKHQLNSIQELSYNKLTLINLMINKIPKLIL